MSKHFIHFAYCETLQLCQLILSTNPSGSFHCECPIGLEVSEDGASCKDIDECGLTSGVCSNGVCENMMGAYQCICDEGYEQVIIKYFNLSHLNNRECNKKLYFRVMHFDTICL